MTFEEYRNLPGINWSTLRHMLRSPLHYDHARSNGTVDSTGRLKGRGTHTAVLEPERLTLDYAVFPGKVRRGKEWEAFKAENAEESILKQDELEHCQRVAAAVHANADAHAIIADGQREHVIEWHDPVTGLPCKARLDVFQTALVADLKGVKSVDLRPLGHEVARMLYHCQLAFYCEGVKQTTGRDPEALLICVEHAPPHDVVVAQIDEDSLYAGWQTVRLLLDRVAECMSTGKWTGRHQGRQMLQLPPWVWPDGDQEMSAEEVIDA